MNGGADGLRGGEEHLQQLCNLQGLDSAAHSLKHKSPNMQKFRLGLEQRHEEEVVFSS